MCASISKYTLQASKQEYTHTRLEDRVKTALHLKETEMFGPKYQDEEHICSPTTVEYIDHTNILHQMVNQYRTAHGSAQLPTNVFTNLSGTALCHEINAKGKPAKVMRQPAHTGRSKSRYSAIADPMISARSVAAIATCTAQWFATSLPTITTGIQITES